jgi:hypothetical protein
MAQDPAKPANKPTPPEHPAWLPEEKAFRARFSPHFEMEISIAAAMALYTVLSVVLILIALWEGARAEEEYKPPRMEVVEIQGGQGGLDNLGFGNTPLGGAGGKDKAENVENTSEEKNPTPTGKAPDVPLIKDPLKAPELKFPDPSKEQPDSTEGGEAFAQLDATVKKVEDDIIKATQPKPSPPSGTKKTPGGVKGPNRKPGTGGPGGKGGGKGGGVGPGSGTSPYGEVRTNQQKRQMRWRILASEDGRIHYAKLKALGITLVVPTGKPNVFQIMDLSQANPTFRLTDQLRNQGDKVWWTNRSPREIAGLAAVLGIRPPPPCFVIFLPKQLEERMLVLEQEYQGATEDQIQQTVWDVPLRNGRYASEPEVKEQILKGGR